MRHVSRRERQTQVMLVTHSQVGLSHASQDPGWWGRQQAGRCGAVVCGMVWAGNGRQVGNGGGKAWAVAVGSGARFGSPILCRIRVTTRGDRAVLG